MARVDLWPTASAPWHTWIVATGGYMTVRGRGRVLWAVVWDRVVGPVQAWISNRLQ